MIRKVAWALIAIGAIILAYNGYNWWQESQLVIHNDKLAKSLDKDWNNLKPRPIVDAGKPIDTKTKLKVGSQIGELIIPRLGSVLPIVHGTDDASLKKGVGHYIGYGTVKPGENGHVVLSGHRDTVFRRVGELKKGDKLIIRYQGNLFTYQIRKTWITHADDRTVIVPIQKPVLSLTTCYPFGYVGNAPDRYIIRAELVEMKKDTTMTAQAK